MNEMSKTGVEAKGQARPPVKGYWQPRWSGWPKTKKVPIKQRIQI